MVVVTGIVQAIKIGLRVAPIAYKLAKKNVQVAKYLYRHPRIAKYGTIAAGTAPLIYDLLNIDYSAIPKKPRSSYPKQKTRNLLDKPFRKQQYCYDYRPRKRYSGR